MKRLDSSARSSQAKTQAVRMPSKPLRSSAAKKAPKSTSPWPMSRCWWTVTCDPGGLTMYRSPDDAVWS